MEGAQRGTKGASKEQEHFQVQADLSTQLARTPPMMLRVQNPNYPPLHVALHLRLHPRRGKQTKRTKRYFFFHLLTYILAKYFQSCKPGTGRVEIAITEPCTGASCPLHDQPHLPFFQFVFFFFLKAGELPAALSSAGAKPLEEAEV